MGDSKFQKIRLLKVYEILKRFSDENNPISTQELISKLNEQGITATRKTIYSDIKELNDYGYSVEINKGSANGYYIIGRAFDLVELKILMDCIKSVDFLTEPKSGLILEKLSRLESESQGKLLLKNCIGLGGNKTQDKAVYYYINTLDIAITNKKQVSFKYTEYNDKGERVLRKDGKVYKTMPINLMVENNKYYLVCYDTRYNDIMLYRVDRMCDITELEDDIDIPLDESALSSMKNKMFSMHVGKEEVCEFLIEKGMLDIVFDEFGDKIVLIKHDESHYRFKAKVYLSSAFISWVIKFGKHVTLLSPAGAVERVKVLVKELNEVYN